MTQESFQEIAHTIPHQPGIYKYFDPKGELLYVGKAKDLRKRVSSYFSKTFTSYKTHELVQRIDRLEFTIVDSEQDALLLENSLIKNYKPRFNIELKDDKTYPYIVIRKEPFPRVYFTRKKWNDGSEYLGPFTSVGKVRDILSFIKEFIPLRTCKLPLTETNISNGKFKVCLEYHLGNCKGPCAGIQSLEEYTEGIQQIKGFLKGNLSPIAQGYKKQMQAYSADLAFEKADAMRKKLEHLENYQAKSVIVSAHLTNIDVFSILKDGNIAYVNYLMVQNGSIIQTHTISLEPKLDETEEEVMSFAIGQIRQELNSLANEIIVPFPVNYTETGLTMTVPKTGDKKKLLDLSLKNVNYFQSELKLKKSLHLEGKTPKEIEETLLELMSYLDLESLPVHIECFDNSNFQGSAPVSAMVCFKNGMPSNKDYRHFHVKTVEGINDFATMKEVVLRRYKRLLDENQSLPQLIVIDGGKGQLSSAMEALEELHMADMVNVVGLAKNEEEIFFPNRSQSLLLPWDSDSLKLLRRIRDEVHRFGITFHRKTRSKQTFKNEIEEIPNIGKGSATKLLSEFKSVKKVKAASLEELTMVVGASKAKFILEYFQAQKK